MVKTLYSILHRSLDLTVKINDTEMSRNKKGLNFVIIDSNTNKVIDSVNFDITEKNAPGMR